MRLIALQENRAVNGGWLLWTYNQAKAETSHKALESTELRRSSYDWQQWKGNITEHTTEQQ